MQREATRREEHPVAFSGQGVLRYRPDWWLTLEVEGDIAAYYRKLLPKAWGVCSSRAPHVTIVRGEEPPSGSEWGKHDGERVGFLYEPGLRWNEHFYWLRVVSKEIERLRTDLGLSVERQPGWSVPPDGYSKYFHLTVGTTLRR